MARPLIKARNPKHAKRLEYQRARRAGARLQPSRTSFTRTDYEALGRQLGYLDNGRKGATLVQKFTRKVAFNLTPDQFKKLEQNVKDSRSRSTASYIRTAVL